MSAYIGLSDVLAGSGEQMAKIMDSPLSAWNMAAKVAVLHVQCTAMQGSAFAQLIFSSQLPRLLKSLLQTLKLLHAHLVDHNVEGLVELLQFWEAGVQTCAAAMSGPENVPNQKNSMSILPKVVELVAESVAAGQNDPTSHQLSPPQKQLQRRLLSTAATFIACCTGENSTLFALSAEVQVLIIHSLQNNP